MSARCRRRFGQRQRRLHHQPEAGRADAERAGGHQRAAETQREGGGGGGGHGRAAEQGRLDALVHLLVHQHADAAAAGPGAACAARAPLRALGEQPSAPAARGARR